MYIPKNLHSLTNAGRNGGNLYFYFNSDRDDVTESRYFKDVRLSIGDLIFVYDNTKVLKFKVIGSFLNDKSVELLDEYSERKVISLTGDSGTLTEEQIKIVKNNKNNVILINNGQVYILSNTDEELTYKTFVSFDVAVAESIVANAIYIQLNKTAVNYGRWTKEELNIVDVLKRVDGYDPSKTQTLQNVNGVFTWVDVSS